MITGKALLAITGILGVLGLSKDPLQPIVALGYAAYCVLHAPQGSNVVYVMDFGTKMRLVVSLRP
jgi:hypothetical protein